MITEHLTIHTTSGYHEVLSKQYDEIVAALKRSDEFVEVTEVFGGGPLIVRCREIVSVSLWTREGQIAFEEHSADLKSLSSEHNPSWKED